MVSWGINFPHKKCPLPPFWLANLPMFTLKSPLLLCSSKPHKYDNHLPPGRTNSPIFPRHTNKYFFYHLLESDPYLDKSKRSNRSPPNRVFPTWMGGVGWRLGGVPLTSRKSAHPSHPKASLPPPLNNNFLNGQNHSSSDSHNPIKKSPQQNL